MRKQEIRLYFCILQKSLFIIHICIVKTVFIIKFNCGILRITPERALFSLTVRHILELLRRTAFCYGVQKCRVIVLYLLCRFQQELIRDKCDEFSVCGFFVRRIDFDAEYSIDVFNLTSVPGDFDRVSDRALYL